MNNLLKETLKQWRSWGLSCEPSLVRSFTQGHNHLTSLIEADERLLVLKIFSHSFDHTIAVEQWASANGLSPDIIYAGDGVQLLNFIDDQGYSPHKLPSLASSLQHLHSTEYVEQTCFDLMTFANEYLMGADQFTLAWHSQLLGILEEFNSDPTPWVFCHNDLLIENCLFESTGKVTLIDWEFAQHHNPWFDLATIVVHFDLSEADAKLFLNAYATTWSAKFSERIFTTSQVAVLWVDLLWNMHKYGANYRATNAVRFAKLALLARQLGVVLTPNAY